MRKPRGFNHTFIYTDERNEAVRQARLRVQNDVGAERGTATRRLFASGKHCQQAHRATLNMLTGILLPVVFTALILAVVLFLI